MNILPRPLEFEWDKGNVNKNRIKHNVTDEECEEPFFDPQKKIFRDMWHSKEEERLILFGTTKNQRALVVVFTIRRRCVRIISARDINKKEKSAYEKAA